MTNKKEYEVKLVLTPDTISENRGKSMVTATISPAAPRALYLDVSENSDAVNISGNSTLFFGEGDTKSTGEVTITGINNNIPTPVVVTVKSW